MKQLSFALPMLLLAPGCGCVGHTHGNAWFAGSSMNLTHESRRESTQTLSFAEVGLVRLDLPAGSVRISESAGPAELRSTVYVRAASDERAQAVLDATELAVERLGEGLSITLVPPPGEARERDYQIAADLELTLPPGTLLDARTGMGKVVAEGAFGDTKLRSGFGEVKASGVRGQLAAESGSGSVEISDARGAEVSGKSSFGQVALRDVDATRVRAESGSGSVQAESIRGDEITLRTSFGAISARELAGRLAVHSGSGQVKVEGFQGALDATSSFGSVTCEGVFTALVVHSGSGAVSVRALAESRVESPWKLSSSFGRVRLSAPADFACEFSAKTGHGTLDIGFPVTVEAGGLKSSRELAGRIGAGGGQVSLSSGSGGVSLDPL